jgi:thiol-disulfide isomerase/thioredoxin
MPFALPTQIDWELRLPFPVETSKMRIDKLVFSWRSGVRPVLLTILLSPFIFSGKARAAGPAVTITEFSDFHCPYCQRAAVVVEQLRQIYGNNVKFVFKQMPFPMRRDE